MKRARRILAAIGITIVALFVFVDFIVPDVLSSYLKKTAPASVYAVPTDLQDLSVSQVPGTRMRYFGYEFEIPWNDIDHADRKPFAIKDSDSAWVSCRSGLKLFIATDPPDAASSDYPLAQLVYDFSPSKMAIWPPSPRTQYRQLILLTSKSQLLSHIPSTPAESGIFNLRSRSYSGFQLGNPRVRQDGLSVQLYSEDGRFEMTFYQQAYEEPAGVTQAEINRVVQTLHRVEAKSPIAQR